MADSSPPATPPKTLAAATGQTHNFVTKIPQLTPKWDPLIVLPKNNVVTNNMSATMVTTSTYPTDRPAATILIQRADNNSNVKTVGNLQLAASNVTDKATSQAPVYQFSLKDGIWKDWNQLNYNYTVTVEQTSAVTPAPVKVKRLHVAAVDNSQDSDPYFLAMRNSEAANFTNAFASCADDVAFAKRFPAPSTTAAQFGAYMLNVYSFNYTGHGGVLCGVCGNMYGVNNSVAQDDPTYLRWTVCSQSYEHNAPYSNHCVGNPWIKASNIKNSGTVETVPLYLAFSICCGGAFEPSLFSAYIARGTKYAIGFRKATLCVWARDYAKDFYAAWAASNCDPGQVGAAYKSLWATWQTKLEPVFFGDGSVPSAPADPKPGRSVGQWFSHVGSMIAGIF